MSSPASLDPASTPVVCTIVIVTYLGIALGKVPGLKLNRTGIIMLGAIAIAVFSRLSTPALIDLVNWPTILLLFGFLIISGQLRLTGFFDVVATAIAARLDHPARFLLILMLATAGLSAFLNHDIVCFVFTPFVATALLRRNLNPVPFLIALAVASNIGAAATPIGNAQDMVIAETAGLSFSRYACWCFPPVAVAMLCSYALIWLLSRHRLQLQSPRTASLHPLMSPLTSLPPQPPTSPPPPPPPQPFNRLHTIKGLVILGLVIIGFFSPIPKELIALTAAAIHLASPRFSTEELLGEVNWPILIMFIGLFVVTGAFQATGAGERAVAWLAHAGVNLHSRSVLAVVTAVLSNLISNSAAVLLLLKVTDLAHPSLAYVLALSNSFGGSLIITGSVSNIIVVQQARELGITISFVDFLRLGLPVTLVAMAGLLAWVAIVV